MTAVFDIIIVGAGTAGCVLANRLSEDPNISVLVLEAGQDRSSDERVYTPGLAPDLQGDACFDWKYVSQPEAGINGRCMIHPRGRLVGGTSAINSFALIYPSAAGIDIWNEVGAEGWDWKTMKPYFKKFQTIREPSEKVCSELNLSHSKETMETSNGPLQASFPISVRSDHKAWLEIFKTLGLETATDPLEGNAIGGHISTCHITNDSHERSHAGTAYLDPVRSRTNLHIITGAVVQRILFDSADGDEAVATGVLYNDESGIEHAVRAKKEVVLAAGTFNTPQLLELSGIGDPAILTPLDIDLVYANCSVGSNLQDHIRTGISFEAVDSLAKSPISKVEARRHYQQDRSGPLAEWPCFSFAYMPLQQFLSSSEKEELKHLLDRHTEDQDATPSTQAHYNFIRKMIESSSEGTATAFLSRKPAVPGVEGNFITLFSMLSHPFSTGSVHITSTNPHDKPQIQFNYYSHPLDIEVHARHAQILEKLAQTPPLSSYIKPGGKKLPQDIDFSTLKGAEDLCRKYVLTNYHPCGTCSIGSVVSGRLKVHGTRNLRVVDASVMPVIPRGNIVTTVYAVAERAANIIQEDLNLKAWS